MVEVTFLIDDIDYSDRLDSQLPLVFETMSKNGDLNPVLKAACKSPEATAKVVKTRLQAAQQPAREAHAQDEPARRGLRHRGHAQGLQGRRKITIVRIESRKDCLPGFFYLSSIYSTGSPSR